MLQNQIYSKRDDFDLQPLDDFSSAFIFQTSPPSVLLLDQHAWLVLKLCNSQSLRELKDAYLSALGEVISVQEAQTNLIQVLEMLEQRGLIASSTPANGSVKDRYNDMNISLSSQQDVLPPFRRLLNSIDNTTTHPYYTGPFEVFEEHQSSGVTWDLDAIFSVVHKYGGRVLEIGCGSGRVALRLVQEGFEVTGIDASEDSLARLSRRLEQKPNLAQNLHIVKGDFLDENLNINSKFNIAVLADLSINLFWQPDAAKALLERVKSMLEPGGVFCFAMFSDASVPKMAVYDGSVKVGSYRDDDSTQRLMWVAIKFENKSHQLHQTYFLEDLSQKNKDISAHLSVLKQMMWSPSTFMPILQNNGFTVVEQIKSAVKGGGADGWETVVVVATLSSN